MSVDRDAKPRDTGLRSSSPLPPFLSWERSARQESVSCIRSSSFISRCCSPLSSSHPPPRRPNGRSGSGRSATRSGTRRGSSPSSRRTARRSSGGSRSATATPAPRSSGGSSTSWTASRKPSIPTNPPPKGTHPARTGRCLNAADGKTVWTHSYDCPYTNVAIRPVRERRPSSTATGSTRSARWATCCA